MIHLAGCILQNDNGDILLLHRNTSELVQWELPGGKIDEGERPEEAARREVAEEVGLTLGALSLATEVTFTEGSRTFHYHAFTARIVEGTPAPLEAKFDEVCYVSITDLPSLALSRGMVSLLPHLSTHCQSVPC